jgi:hypothetical protein
MKAFGVAAVSALLVAMAGWAVPARAQMGGGSEGPHVNLLSDTPSKTPDEIEADQAKQKAYKESLKKIPDAKGGNDPWGAVRNDAPKSAPAKSTSAKAKTKSGSNTPN